VNVLVVLKDAETIYSFDDGADVVIKDRKYFPSEFGSGCMFYDRWTNDGRVIGLDPRVW
jgi:hypothetical protein